MGFRAYAMSKGVNVDNARRATKMRYHKRSIAVDDEYWVNKLLDLYPSKSNKYEASDYQHLVKMGHGKLYEDVIYNVALNSWGKKHNRKRSILWFYETLAEQHYRFWRNIGQRNGDMSWLNGEKKAMVHIRKLIQEIKTRNSEQKYMECLQACYQVSDGTKPHHQTEEWSSGTESTHSTGITNQELQELDTMHLTLNGKHLDARLRHMGL